MAKDLFQKVAYCGLRNPDGTYLLNVPLYVKVSDFNKNGLTDQQEELINRVTEIAIKRYEKQIREHMMALEKKKKEAIQNDTNFVPS